MEVSAVKLRNSYQIQYVDTNNLFVTQNSMCVIETEHGLDVGNVMKCKKFQCNPEIEVKGKLLRKMNEQDMKRIPDIEAIEREAFIKCREKARAKNLNMKLITVKCLFDKTKIIFYFVAENRIDFRELVRELASQFRTRIEMRQIGVRDEARLIGGYGPCGQELCCAHTREEFEPVSIKMAKEQSLNLNSMKISGMCGRLLCCLGYEYHVYRSINEAMPKPGSEIHAEDRKFAVLSIDTLKESMLVRDGERLLTVRRDDITHEGNSYRIKPDALVRLNQADEEESLDDTY